VALRSRQDQELTAAIAASKAAAQTLAQHEAAIKTASDRSGRDREVQQQVNVLREAETRARVASAARAKAEQEAIAASQTRAAAEIALKTETERKLKIEHELAAAIEARVKADRDETRLIEQRCEAEKRLVDTVSKLKKTEEAALLAQNRRQWRVQIKRRRRWRPRKFAQPQMPQRKMHCWEE